VLVGDPPIELTISSKIEQAAQREAGEGEPTDSMERTVHHWQRMWDEATVGRHTYALLPSIKARMNSKHIQLDYVTTQYISGHGDFAAKLFEWRKKEFPICECGEDNETAVHALRDCPRYSRARLTAEIDGLDFSKPDTLLAKNNFTTFVKLCRVIARAKGTQGSQ